MKFLFAAIASILLSTKTKAAPEPISSGSFIINMGVTPQTYANGVKPWGMIYDLIHNYRVKVKWVINQTKSKDGIDFTYNGVDYKGGTFIIPAVYRTAAVNARIAYWQTQGVMGATTNSVFTVDVSYTLKYTPRWTFDFQNGDIAQGFLAEAGIPFTDYPMKYPSELGSCDDLFVMPHADPSWATHSNLLYWNQSNKGWIWGGCHATSALENIVNPADTAVKMNFLSTGLLLWGDHGNGSPPYSYRYPTDPEMQFMGILDDATRNGSEQIFMPQLAKSWRPETKVAVYDPTHNDIPSESPGEAAVVVYGRAFGDTGRGKVMYVGGHDINKGDAEAVSAIRNFFNYSFMSVYDKAINPSIVGPVNLMALNSYTYSCTLPPGYISSDYTYHWYSSCGGYFLNPFDSVTIFIAPSMANCTSCTIYCMISDGCGRQYYEGTEVAICPIVPPVALDRTTDVINNPAGTTAQPVGMPVPLAGTDEDGYVVSYVMMSLPSNGILYYDNDTSSVTSDIAINSLPGGELILSPVQMKSLKFDPADGFGNSTSFLYTVIDNSSLRDLTPATYSIPVNPPPTTDTKICTPVAATAGISGVCSMSATDNGTIVSYTIKKLPPSTQCYVYVKNVDAYVGQVLTLAEATQITFRPSGKYVGYSEVLYTATDNNGATDLTPATLTLQMVNQAPVAFGVAANNIANPVGAVQYALPSLASSDEEGNVASYVIKAVPAITEGILYYAVGSTYTPLFGETTLNVAQGSTLKFDPNDSFTGVANLLFTVKDSMGLIDNTPDTLSIPVNHAIPLPNNQTIDHLYAGYGWKPVPGLSGTGSITEFTITRVPPATEGSVGPDLNNNGIADFIIGVDAGKELPYTLTVQEANALMFKPACTFRGNTYFTFSVKNAVGTCPANGVVQFTNIYNTLPVANDVANVSSISHTAGATAIADFSATDADWSVVGQDINNEYFQITTLPSSTKGVLMIDGTPLQQWDRFTVAAAGNIKFDPATGASGEVSFTYTYIDRCGVADPTPATYKIYITGPVNIVPVSADYTMLPVTAKSVVVPVTGLNGTDADGTVVQYKFMAGLNPNEGILYLDGAPITNNQVIPADKAGDLYIIPSGTWTGISQIKYKSVDNLGALSFQTYIIIPITNSAPVAYNKTMTEVKKGATVLMPSLYAVDADGTIASYTVVTLPSLGTVKVDLNGNNGWTNVTTGQVLTPAQAGRLRITTSNTIGTYSLTYTATDNLSTASNVATITIPVIADQINQVPTVDPITTAGVNMAAGITAISPLSAKDADGTIVSYMVMNIPPDYYGKIYYTGPAGLDSITYSQKVLTVTEAATLKFKPSGLYSGNIVFTFRAKDDEFAISSTVNYTIPVTNNKPVTADITNAAVSSTGGPTVLNALSATDETRVESFIIKILPTSAMGNLVLDGTVITVNQEIPALYGNRIEFDPNPSFTGTASFKYTAKDAFGEIDNSFATVTIPVNNTFPEAVENNSQVITNLLGLGSQFLPAPGGTDPDGTIASYTIMSLPANGKFYVNGTLVSTLPSTPTGGLTITPLQASQLSFDPNDNFNTSSSFTFTVTDNSGNTDATPAIYTIYSNVPPVTSNVNAVGMNANQARTNIKPLLASDDVAVSFFTITSIPSPEQGVLYVNNVPVTSLSEVENISPASASQLSFEPAATFKGALFTYTATDNLGIIDVTPSNYTIPFGAGMTLPVELVSFTGYKAGSNDILNWSTASEFNSDKFDIETSKDGVNFQKAGSVKAVGTATAKTDYVYTEKNVSGTMNYYRLKMIDIDLQVKYSKVIVLKRNSGGFTINSIAPNPFRYKFSIDFGAEIAETTYISLVNMAGTTVKTITVSARKGMNHVEINDLSILSSGNYQVVLMNSRGIASSSILKVP